MPRCATRSAHPWRCEIGRQAPDIAPTQVFSPRLLRVRPDGSHVCPDFVPADSWALCVVRREPMESIKVLVVDDNAKFLESAVRFLATEPGVAVVGQASSGREAIDMVEILRPDVVLMDVTMPGMSGLEAARRIKAGAAAPKVLVISMHDSPAHRMAAEDAGVDGYVGKWEFAGSVVAAIKAVVPPCPGAA